MPQLSFKVYGYRWVMLSIFMLIVAVNQMLWITFAPITTDAMKYYAVSDLKIGMLSMCFMIVYILVSIPASWIIDRFGIRTGVGIGAVLTGVFGLTRGLFNTNFNLVFISQIGIAIGQPFILNAITKFSARWFSLEERATATGLGTLSMYIGILLGMLLTPYLVAGTSIGSMLYIYGVISIIAASIFIILMKEAPPTAPCLPEQEERALVMDGFKIIFSKRDFNWLLLIFFIGLGAFNSVTTWIEEILKPRGFSATQAGITGGLMIVGGIIGALFIPILSDRLRKRIPFIIISLSGATLGIAGIAYASTYPVVLLSAAFSGFFLLSAGPIGFQYGAEITYPASEGTSNGLLLLMGQISGIAFIFGLNGFKSESGAMTKPLTVLIILMVFAIAISAMLKEATILLKSKQENSPDENLK